MEVVTGGHGANQVVVEEAIHGAAHAYGLEVPHPNAAASAAASAAAPAAETQDASAPASERAAEPPADAAAAPPADAAPTASHAVAYRVPPDAAARPTHRCWKKGVSSLSH